MLNSVPEPLAPPVQNKHHQIHRSPGLGPYLSPGLAGTPRLSPSRASQPTGNRPLLSAHSQRTQAVTGMSRFAHGDGAPLRGPFVLLLRVLGLTFQNVYKHQCVCTAPRYWTGDVQIAMFQDILWGRQGAKVLPTRHLVGT